VPGIANTVNLVTQLETRLLLGARILLDSGLQVRYLSANESALSQTKYGKIGEHEQGR
jgi:hypothetical protein